MRCAALNVYSFAQVSVTSRAVRVSLLDDAGRAVKETPKGPACRTLTIPRH
jgi:hypothetical protein